MKKVILSDFYGIVQRIKKLDKDYFVVYNTMSKQYELHHKKQQPTFCITLYKKLDKRSLVKTYKSQTKNCLEIFRAIDKTNENIQNHATKYVANNAKQMLKENLAFAKNY
jgi:hypothetical protein